LLEIYCQRFWSVYFTQVTVSVRSGETDLTVFESATPVGQDTPGKAEQEKYLGGHEEDGAGGHGADLVDLLHWLLNPVDQIVEAAGEDTHTVTLLYKPPYMYRYRTPCLSPSVVFVCGYGSRCTSIRVRKWQTCNRLRNYC
jgi:hypothetical protein